MRTYYNYLDFSGLGSGLTPNSDEFYSEFDSSLNQTVMEVNIASYLLSQRENLQ